MAIVINNLRHTYMVGSPYEKNALIDINININDGESVGIIGHTGSGKSTLVQHLNGILMPVSGSININGIDVNKKNMKEIRKQVGLVFQYPEHQLFEETVFKDIGYGLSKQGYEGKTVEEKILQTINIIGLDKNLLEKSPFRLSGGEKRKVAIAGVLAMKPKVLILDEPGAGLDPKGRDEIYDAVVKFKKENNATIILVSHSMEDLARYVDRIIVLNRGRIEMDGTVAEVFKNDELLKNIGLSVPQITCFMRLLKKKLPELNSDVFTVKEAKEAILGYLNKREI
ncbi:Sulfate-transporting ATPase [Pseudobacteroides cellulosolvens ATCC 35603 = DSM 2933]|uniref:Energy-coupling factor transporter ATP-binding protein EcfA2 n=1 Tax=Pseudobacteroides cellulosolvens ATCC 35603 = DSM 2933 TaxID=398512 RepID=A0A0L6JND3_9FIRM|nr:energy-coupling factor transporter ATPase [Pseudobacteroides cellulosolvens]KNY27235.1 Sulfate-transporting ATPase [Pseudobacteroides cellulosolvens ATCC 35603 = DSM 2933]